MMREKIAIIGAGSWGTTLAILLSEKGYDTTLWAYEAEVIQHIETNLENSIFLPEIPIPHNLKITNSLQEAVTEKSTIVSVVPSHFLRLTTEHYCSFLSPQVHFVSATKGIEEETLLRMSQVIHQAVPSSLQINFTVLSGPSFAREVSNKKATAITVAGEDPDETKYIQQLFSTPFFRVYRNNDVIGVELAGAVKNVIAIAAGISDGLGFGNNARAALITRGLAEIVRLGKALGASSSTFYGLSGVGDLILTCTGDLSRNRSLGLRLGAGETLSAILNSSKMVAEGVKTTKSVINLAQRHSIEMPITEQVAAVLFKGKNPTEAFVELMGRSLKYEN